jgi:hypothetical protein
MASLALLNCVVSGRGTCEVMTGRRDRCECRWRGDLQAEPPPRRPSGRGLSRPPDTANRFGRIVTPPRSDEAQASRLCKGRWRRSVKTLSADVSRVSGFVWRINGLRRATAGIATTLIGRQALSARGVRMNVARSLPCRGVGWSDRRSGVLAGTHGRHRRHACAGLVLRSYHQLSVYSIGGGTLSPTPGDTPRPTRAHSSEDGIDA